MSNNIEFVSLDEIKENEYKLTELADIASETYVPVSNNPPVKIFGVLPKKKHLIFFKRRNHK